MRQPGLGPCSRGLWGLRRAGSGVSEKGSRPTVPLVFKFGEEFGV